MLTSAQGLLVQQEERGERRRLLERSLGRAGVTAEERQERRREHAARETEFLRLKRSKLGAGDLDSVRESG